MWLERLEGNGLWLLDWFRHQRRDAFWRHGSVCEDYAAIEAPVYAVGGWADGYTNAIFRLLDHLPGPRKGLIGPWAHKYPHFATPEPRIGFLQECLRWWDQHLKGIDTGIMNEPMLRAWVQDPARPTPHHVERPGAWAAEDAWVTAERPTRTLHVTPGGLSAASGTDEPIILSCPEIAGWTAPSWCAYGIDPDGPLDQRGEAAGMSLFDTAPLDDDLDLLGFPFVEAEVACDRPNGLLAATLSAVDPDGAATLISFGVLNLTHRAGHADPAPMAPGKAEPVRVQLNACGQRIARGQKLRLALSNAYWPVVFPSPEKTVLTLDRARLVLPVRSARPEDAALTPFPPAEGAAPLEAEAITPGSYSRTRTIDYVTGEECYARLSDTGTERHLHTGLIVSDVNEDRFWIHPDDPATARGACRWLMTFRRDGWSAEVEAEISVAATPEHWRIEASLLARDKDGEVFRRAWSEAVPRDLV